MREQQEGKLREGAFIGLSTLGGVNHFFTRGFAWKRKRDKVCGKTIWQKVERKGRRV